MKIRQLADLSVEIGILGAEVLVVATGSVREAADLTSRLKLPFTVLGDSTGAVVQAYGAYQSLFGLVQRNATLVIDQEGVVRYLKQSANPAKNSLVPEEVLVAIRSVAQGAWTAAPHPAEEEPR